MRRWTSLAAPALLVLLLATGEGRAQSTSGTASAPAAESNKQGFVEKLNPINWFGGKKAAPKKNGDKKNDAKRGRPLSASEKAALLHAQEQAKWMRRLAVCQKLMEIAERTKGEKGEALRRMARQLDERAWKIYQQRTANLLAPGTMTFEEPIADDPLREAELANDTASTTSSPRQANGRTTARRDR